MIKTKKNIYVLFVSFLFSNLLYSSDIALIDAVNKGRFYSIKSALRNGANPNCRVGQNGDSVLIFAIKRLVDEIQKDSISIPRETKRFIVGALLVTPAALALVAGTAGIAAGPEAAAATGVAVALLTITLPLIAILLVATGLIGSVKIGRSMWRVIIAKPYQGIRRAINVFCRKKVIAQLLDEEGLHISLQNDKGQSALDVVHEYALNESLVSNMYSIEKMLLARKNA